jgi:hypothetical protein
MDILIPTPTALANQPLLLCEYNTQLLSHENPSLLVTAYITLLSRVLIVSGYGWLNARSIVPGKPWGGAPLCGFFNGWLTKWLHDNWTTYWAMVWTKRATGWMV